MTPVESLFRALLSAFPNGLRLLAVRGAPEGRYIVAYEPAESPEEAGENPLGFLTLSDNGGALAVPVPAPEGTNPEEAKALFAERERLLGELGAFDASSEAGSRFGRGFDREGRLLRPR
jgi:hypothetical protein